MSRRSSRRRSGPVPDEVPSSSPVSPGRSIDTSNDVLYFKGAAAQTTTNPGNLYFYQLCEERYDQFAETEHLQKPKRDHLRSILGTEIVDAIQAKGGTFRRQSGAAMTRADAMRKSVDRLRQIGKPKIRPTGFGENDVVFTRYGLLRSVIFAYHFAFYLILLVCFVRSALLRGAANFLYAGNVKWRNLMDTYVTSYFRTIIDEHGNIIPDVRPVKVGRPANRRSNGKFSKGNGVIKTRPQYQKDVLQEVIGTIKRRGGLFRDEHLNVVSDKAVLEKAINRFKDIKKELVAGTRTFPPRASTGEIKREGGAMVSSADSSEVETETDASRPTSPMSGRDCISKRAGGFTSVKNVVLNRELMKKKRKGQRSSRKKLSSRPSRNNDDSDDDADSWDSSMLDSDDESNGSSDDEDSSSDESEDCATKAKLLTKRTQENARADRLKRRFSGDLPQPQHKKKMRVRKKAEPAEAEELTKEIPLSEYELYRLGKIKRNQAKLAELGLLHKR